MALAWNSSDCFESFMYNYENFSGIVVWYLADRIPGILPFSSNIVISLIFILNSKIALVFETEMLNSTANEESLQRVGRFFI